MAKHIQVKVGDKYYRWTIIKETQKMEDKRCFVCKCDCGTVSTIRLSTLRQGKSKSCGCLAREKASELGKKAFRHGKCHTRIYQIWADIKQRCMNPKIVGYKNYGGRGISVCTEWFNFDSFYKWSVLSGYKKELTIERIDNNGNYEPSNCTWIPASKQIRNQRRSHRITYNDRTQILTEWAKEVGLKKNTLVSRFRNGWSTEKALTTPMQEKFSHAI
jgi:hypothetical protein